MCGNGNIEMRENMEILFVGSKVVFKARLVIIRTRWGRNTEQENSRSTFPLRLPGSAETLML